MGKKGLKAQKDKNRDRKDSQQREKSKKQCRKRAKKDTKVINE